MDRRGSFAVAGLDLVYRAYHATLRVRVLLPDGSVIRPAEYRFAREVFALCEADAPALGGLIAGAGFTVLVARGRDGDLASALLERLGCRLVRGSSLHDGSRALRELVRCLVDGDGPAAVVVDGPVGPAGEAKTGVVACGLATGRPVRALAAAARHRVVVPRTWSGIYLPLPFSRVVVTVDEPLPLAERVMADVESLAAELSQRLRRLRERAVAAAR